jgi:membrane dipeptidase
MRRGEVGICLATLLARSSGLNDPQLDYRSREIASAAALGQLAYYRVLERQGCLQMIRGWKDLETHLSRWNAPTANLAPLGFILSMEGADPILKPDDIPHWWDDGLRVIGLAHYGRSAYAHGTGVAGGLSPEGPALLRAMDAIGMILDVTHLADESFWQAVDHFEGPVLASHNNCRSLIPGDRQFSDDQIRYLIGRDSVIGVVCDSWMLHRDYVFGKTQNSLVTLEAVADHIDHICQLAGTARHAAIGSDLDGGFGKEQSPHDLETIADLQRVAKLLRERGYSEPDVEGVMHGNWIRFFKKAWGLG